MSCEDTWAAIEGGYPEDPPGIDPETHSLPTPAAAAERLCDFISAWGDGLIDLVHDGTGTPMPLYARDVIAVALAVQKEATS